MNAVTMHDVAKEAGVSITTVSRVINSNYPVGKNTRIKVESAIEKLHFSPNILARGLISKKTHTIGILVPSITNMFFPVVINAVQEFFKAHNYQIMMCSTGAEPKEEAAYLSQMLSRQVDGIISIDPRTESIKQGTYERAADIVPLVLINGFNEGLKLNFVLNDQKSGAKEAVEYLVSLGHRRIAFIRGRHSYSNDVKEEACRSVLESRGIALPDDYCVVLENGNSIETLDMSKMAIENLLKITNRPTAILACNDWMAVGALYAARSLNIDVPKELSIIGYDNIVISEISMPRLTTVDQNMHNLGVSAAKQLFNIMNGNQEGYIRLVLDTKLVIRDSCGVAKID